MKALARDLARADAETMRVRDERVGRVSEGVCGIGSGERETVE
ncbi:hypothetical protein [Sphingomonas lacusdianchii]|nr:hypothetical protein [Sphingomonas sp. JXJ CY 53]